MIFPESPLKLSGNSFCKQTLSLKTIDKGSCNRKVAPFIRFHSVLTGVYM